MRWTIRWTDFRTFRDYEMFVDADSREQAEAAARERRITVTSVEPMGDDDAVPSGVPLTLLGRPLRAMQVASLMLCGITTIGVLLHSAGMLSSPVWMPL
jgi:hypothetical protein